MSYEYKVKKGGFELNKVVVKETVEDILNYPIRGNKERGIYKATCERYGVRCSVSEADGKTITGYYFPSYDQRGNITGFTKQDVTKEKTEKGHWTAIGKVNISNKLFGQNVADTIQRKHTNLIVTEGQWDCLSVYQAIKANREDTKYKDIEEFVVSIPLGTANAVESMMSNKGFVVGFEKLTMFFDDDYATESEKKKGIMKGKEAKDAVASAFLSDIKILTVQPESGFKDASDYMQAGKSDELAKLVQFDKFNFASEKVAHVGDISFEDLITPLPHGLKVDCFPRLMEITDGFRLSELTLVTSPSGVGKTTSLTKIAEGIVDKGERVGLIYLEETNKKTLQRMVASQLKVSYNKFKRDPLSVATREDIEIVYNDLKNSNKVVMLDHFGSMPITELLAKIKHMHFVDGCKYILLDHLSMVISGSDIADERKELDIVMTELAAFCSANPVHVLAVVHLNRKGSDEIKAPKGKEDEPFWIRVTKETMRGSASLEQLSFNILGLEPEVMPDRSRGRVRWTVLKNREYSELGIADTYSIDTNTWDVVLYPENNGFQVTKPEEKKVVTITDEGF